MSKRWSLRSYAGSLSHSSVSQVDNTGYEPLLTVSPIADIPHRVMQDDVQDGYLIPKGSLVVANISYVPYLDD